MGTDIDAKTCTRHPGYARWECVLLGAEECPEFGRALVTPPPIHPKYQAALDAALAAHAGEGQSWERCTFRNALEQALFYDDPEGILAEAITSARQPLLPWWYGQYWDRTQSGCAYAARESVRQHAARHGLVLRES